MENDKRWPVRKAYQDMLPIVTKSHSACEDHQRRLKAATQECETLKRRIARTEEVLMTLARREEDVMRRWTDTIVQVSKIRKLLTKSGIKMPAGIFPANPSTDEGLGDSTEGSEDEGDVVQ
jgi:hypothetical protein